MLKHLDPRPGQAILDIGCGTGATVAALRQKVGETGRVVGVDNSPGMLARARKRLAGNEWTNVELRQADASATPHGDALFDSAVALTSFSAMPDPRAAIEHAHRALRPGGRLFVFDMRLVVEGHLGRRIMTRFLRLGYRVTAGFTGVDVLSVLRNTFATVEPILGNDRMTILVATKESA